MSWSRLFAAVAAVAALSACGEPTFTYELEAEIVIPADLAADLVTPSVVEVEWMGEVHGVELICEPLDGEHRATFSGRVETLGHASNQAFTARVLEWPADEPCDPELLGTFAIAPFDRGPWVHTFVFPDTNVGLLGERDNHRAESITVEVGFGD